MSVSLSVTNLLLIRMATSYKLDVHVFQCSLKTKQIPE